MKIYVTVTYLVMMRTSFFIYNNQKGITPSLKISPPKKRFNCGLTLKLHNMYLFYNLQILVAFLQYIKKTTFR